MAYNSSVLFCIKVSFSEPVSIRYNQIVWQHNITLEKFSILKAFSKNSQNIIDSYGESIEVSFPMRLF